MEKEIELEKSKFESYLENITNLEKRLDRYHESSDDTDNRNLQVELLNLSESYQKQLINFKVDYERNSNKLPTSTQKSLLSVINNLVDKFKNIILK